MVSPQGQRILGFAASLLLYLILASHVFGQSAATVRVEVAPTVTRDRVVLGEIAAIEASANSSERLKSIPLGYAPAVGATREITRERIAMSISAAGFGRDEVVLLSPAKSVISRSSQTVDPGEIELAMKRAILEPLNASGVSASFARLDVPPNVAVPAGKIELRVGSIGAANVFSPFSASLEIRIDGTVAKRIAVNAEVEAFAEVYVAVTDIAANSKITHESVRPERRRIAKPVTNYITADKNIKGIVAVRNIKAGDELTSDAIVSGIVVRTGDTVRIVGRSGDLQIVVNGTAKASGRIGERIPVANAESKNLVQATVVDEGVVRVSF